MLEVTGIELLLPDDGVVVEPDLGLLVLVELLASWGEAVEPPTEPAVDELFDGAAECRVDKLVWAKGKGLSALTEVVALGLEVLWLAAEDEADEECAVIGPEV